jgi:hypothetical protein
MNVTVITKSNVKSEALDILAKELPAIISELLEVPGGYMALLKPEQVSLEFSQASTRDVGSDIRIKILSSSNEPRLSSKHTLAREILEKIVSLFSKFDEKYSIDIRLYLMEIGVAEHSVG